MTRYVAFLRAINVGGHIVKMDRLRELFLSAGLANVSTFIASGNVLFESKRAPTSLEALIEKTLQSALGYEVATMLRSAAEVARIIDRVDALGLAGGPGGLYIGLLKQTPSAHAATAVAAMSNDIDTLLVDGRELYWRCATSFSDSTVPGPALGRALGVAVTTRNVSTVRKLAGRLASG
jgi:uncharacterized protein (DUF1697 family)